MLSRRIARAEPARAHTRPIVRSAALVLAFCFAATPGALNAAPPRPSAATALETRSLKDVLARNAAAPAAPAIADDAFTRRARLREVKLAPDGSAIAFLEADSAATRLNLLDVKTRKKRTLLTVSGNAALHWSNDSAVLFLDSGDGLAAVSVADGTSSKIAAFDRRAEQRFVSIDPSRPRHVLTDTYDRAAKRYRLTRVSADGSAEAVYEGERKLGDFLVDATGNLSFIRVLDQDWNQLVLRRHEGKWIEATRCKRLRACSLIAASSDQRFLSMIINHQDDRKALVQIDLHKQGAREQATRVLSTDPLALADLRTVVMSPGSQQALFAVYDAPARRNIGLTAAARKAASDIGKRFAASNITINASDAAPHWLLTERGARLSQERYWLYDRESRKIEEILQQERALGEALPEQHLAQKIPLHYRASDGALVHGYLSLPPGKPAAGLPMLTMVHGGPWGKFDSDYAGLVQLMVNRGYAVFQPNFRASTGYGDRYMLAAGADFGNGRVQADIIDGVRWLLAQGVGDSKRLAIMGDSFGGYATLLALTHTPDLFQFGMATVPPPDFVRTMRVSAAVTSKDDEVPFATRLAAMGIDLADAAAMQRIAADAPPLHAARLGKPLMVLAGGKDDRVEIALVTDYVAKLQGLGKPVSLLVDPDEGHNPRKPIVRQAYMYLLQRMGHAYLGGPAPAAPSAELAAYLEQTMKAKGAL